MTKKITGLNSIEKLCIILLFTTLFVGCGSSKIDTKTDEKANSTQKNAVTGAKAGDAENVSNSNSEFPQKQEVLWDFRKTDSDKTPNFPKEETKLVLTYLFGDKWDKDLTISSRVSGSFTKPNAKETLYYVGGCEEEKGFQSTSNCAHVSWWNAGRVAIYDGTTPVGKLDAALGYQIGKIKDVNGDGIDEILSLTGFTNQGATESGATLGHIADGKYEEIKSFGGYSDNCGSDNKAEQIEKAAVVSYIPSTNSKIPTFTEEYFQGNCENPQWKKITKKEFENE